MIFVKQIVLGDIESNCYILAKDGQALIVDPGFSPEIIKQEIQKLKVEPLAILLTHAHYDHIGAVDELVAAYDVPVYLAPDEIDWLAHPDKNLSSQSGQPVIIHATPTALVYDQDYHLGNFEFQVVHTPGHSPGGVSFIFADERLVITGDALFAMSVGRTDLPGSEPEKQLPALKKELLTLPDDYKIYPGHRGASTIGQEKEHNPFFQ